MWEEYGFTPEMIEKMRRDQEAAVREVEARLKARSQLTPEEIIEEGRQAQEASRREGEARLNARSQRTSDIYWSPVLREIASYSDAFVEIAKRDSVLKFPDGSICINVQSDFMDAFNAFSPLRLSGRIRLIPHTVWRAPKSFPAR